ncbi:unnamed protein product [Polarella glacialis]|uniref:VLRF1 domain-containing protein n=2 Tax=Polarella glacialis TaxID=89957 RepID=A0A813GRE5_POLGL|nr:unnamed protein product [Polarella glacialis]
MTAESEEPGTAQPESTASSGARTSFRPSARKGRGADTTSVAGLPIFCRARHFARGANVYNVPLWDLTSRWLPEELKAFSSVSSASSAKVAVVSADAGISRIAFQAALGAESDGEDPNPTAPKAGTYRGDDEDAPSDSDQSETGWEGPLGGESRVWSRAAVDGGLLLLRRVQAAALLLAAAEEGGAPAPSYGLGVSAALFSPEFIAEGADVSLDKRLAQILRTREPHFAVCALRSGHFAGAVFRGQEAIVHKAIHRYTVRAKAGGAQSSCDGGKTVKSVGSSLRRYGEVRLAEEIKELMTKTWAAELAAYELVLVSVSNRMKSTLLGTEKEPFLPESAKVRKMPFMVGKPTFEAIREAYLRVACVTFADEKTAEVLAARFRPAPAKPAPVAEAAVKQAAPKIEAAPVKPYCEDEDELYTALHAAAAAEDEELLTALLDDGANPCVRDGKGRVPYHLCYTQRTRDAFRRYRGSNEEEWDWGEARVPDGINDETDQKKREKEKDKNKRKKDKAKANKVQAKEEADEKLRKDEEERKMLEAAQSKCDSCSKPLVSKPFSRLSFLYCSPDCVKTHMRELQAEAAMKRFSGT